MDQTKIWEYFQNDEEIGDTFANARSRYEYLASYIAPGMKALNIGVGRGGLEHILIEKSVLVSCLDPGEEAVGKLQKKYDLGESAQVGFSQDIPFPSGEFDVVVMSEVLEHLNDEILKLTLGEVRRVLKPGAGRFIGTVPADENLLEGRVICPHCNDAFHRWGHVQSFNMANLDALLATHFTDIKISRHFFGEFAALNWKGRMSWIAKKALLKFGVKGNSENYFFLAKNH